MSTPATTSAPAAAKQSKLYNLVGKLVGNVEIRSANTATGPKPFAYGKIHNEKTGKTTTIMTFVNKGIAFLTGLTDGTEVRLYGTYTQGDKGRTFSAMGESIKKVAAPTAEIVADEAPVVAEEIAPAPEVVEEAAAAVAEDAPAAAEEEAQG